MAILDAAGFQQATGVSRETLDRLSAYVDLLQRWQPRINLIANSTLHDVWERHLLDCAQLIEHLPKDATVLGDFGSGAGLPGLVLAMLAPDLEVHLVEVDAKKCAFLQEAARLTETAVEIHRLRIDAVTLPPLDVATARALAPLAKCLSLVAPHLDAHGICLFHKGKAWGEELTAARQRWMMQVDALPSLTDRAARILKVSELQPQDR
jgi:16S rRNA (guanine527-N7)-methyltransferase